MAKKKVRKCIVLHGDGSVGYLSKDGTIYSPKEIVGSEMANVYSWLVDRGNEKNPSKKKEMEENILFHLKVLDSLSNAYNSIK